MESLTLTLPRLRLRRLFSSGLLSTPVSFTDGNKESTPTCEVTSLPRVSSFFYGTEIDSKALRKLSQTIYNKDEVNPCLRALGFSEAAAIREKTLGLLLDGIVRAQDIYMPEGGIPKGIQGYWRWMNTN